jgi:hypothetical protein
MQNCVRELNKTLDTVPYPTGIRCIYGTDTGNRPVGYVTFCRSTGIHRSITRLKRFQMVRLLKNVHN